MKRIVMILLITILLCCCTACAPYENGEFPNENPVGQVVYKSEISSRTCSIDGEVLKVVTIIIKTDGGDYLIMESNDGYHPGGRYTSASVNKSEQNYEAISQLQLNQTYCFFTDSKSSYGKYRKIISFKDAQ